MIDITHLIPARNQTAGAMKIARGYISHQGDDHRNRKLLAWVWLSDHQ